MRQIKITQFYTSLKNGQIEWILEGNREVGVELERNEKQTGRMKKREQGNLSQNVIVHLTLNPPGGILMFQPVKPFKCALLM